VPASLPVKQKRGEFCTGSRVAGFTKPLQNEGQGP